MDNIGSNKPIPSYKEEFQHSVDLFNRSFQAYQESKIENQKQAFKDVMDKATHIMDETGSKCLSSSGQQQLTTLKTHYDSFIKNPSSAIMQAIQNDLNNLKNC